MRLFCFGIGYSARALILGHRERFKAIAGTVRSGEKADALRLAGIAAHAYAGGKPGGDLVTDLSEADVLLVTAAPTEQGDPMLADMSPALDQARRLKQVVYLSTIGVYGDSGGAWIDETTPVAPNNVRSQRRVEAEAVWSAFGQKRGIGVQLHRLAGIYGPGRNLLIDVAEGSARRIIKPGQVFNRIHVADIAGAIAAALDHPDVTGPFNICDDEPSPPQDVVAHAADLLRTPPPPAVPFEDAAMSEMGRIFYSSSKRCRNDRAKAMLGWTLTYPTYREGLAALLQAGEGRW
jgi:nucleoside-diphosphate-sugar epimerase